MLQDEKVLITGATGGIGSHIAIELDALGYDLLLTGQSAKKLRQLTQKLTGKHHISLLADLTQKDHIERLMQATEAFKPTMLINCLGVNCLSTTEGLTSEQINQMIAINLIAPIQVCKSILPLLKTQKTATIVNVGSILGSIGYPGSCVYCASKFGLRGFTEALRRELNDTNIKVIYFAPRATNTQLNTQAISEMNQALGNSVDAPQAVAKQLLRLLKRKKAKDYYVGWPESFFVRINGLFPSLVDSSLKKQLKTIKQYCST